MQSLEPRPNAPATELLRDAVQDARRLIQIELALAREELRREIKSAKVAGASFGLAALIAIVGLTMFPVAIALAFVSSGTAALVVGAVLLAMAGTVAMVGVLLTPKKPLGMTRSRVRADITAVAHVRDAKE